MTLAGSIGGAVATVVVALTDRVIIFASKDIDGVLNGDCLLNDSGEVSSIV